MTSNARRPADVTRRRIALGTLALLWAASPLWPRAIVEAELVPPGFSEKGIEAARGAEEHRGLAVAYDRQAEDLRASAKAHRDKQRAYEQPPYSSAEPEMARHCGLFADCLEAAAKEALALSEAHLRMAAEAGKEAR